MVINERFPVLSTVAKILWLVGIFVGIIGILSLVAELIEYSKTLSPGAEWVWTTKDYAKITAGLVFIPMGLFIMAVAESIGVLFAIEKNTRK